MFSSTRRIAVYRSSARLPRVLAQAHVISSSFYSPRQLTTTRPLQAFRHVYLSPAAPLQMLSHRSAATTPSYRAPHLDLAVPNLSHAGSPQRRQILCRAGSRRCCEHGVPAVLREPAPHRRLAVISAVAGHGVRWNQDPPRLPRKRCGDSCEGQWKRLMLQAHTRSEASFSG
jgi:hypothetical protein